MTIQSATARVSFACNSVSTIFPVAIQAYLPTDFLVIATNAGLGTETTLTLNSDYTLAPSGTLSPTAWTLTTQTGQLASPYATGYTLQVILNPTQTQITQYTQGQAFPSLSVQTNIDRLTQMLIRQQDLESRSIQAPDGDINPQLLLPAAALRANLAPFFDANGNIILGTIPTTAFTQAIFNTFLSTSPAITYPQTGAERAASVTPSNVLIAPNPIDPRRYGADNTGTTFSDAAWASAIAVARNSSAAVNGGRRIYVNGTQKVQSLNFASSAAQLNAGAHFNNGFTLFGDGNNSSIINIETAAANNGIGIDCGAMAYFSFSDIQFNFGTSAANCPRVGLLLARGNDSGTVFSGLGQFQRCIFNAYGTYNVYDYCAEQINFADCQFLGLSPTTIPVVLSRVNTAAITSPNFTIDTNNVSMTDVSFTGAQSAISWGGNGTSVPGVLFDIGTSTGIAGIDFDVTYMPATGSTSVCLADNGGAGSELQNIHSKCLISEQNAGSGTQQVAVFSAASTRHINLAGYSAFGSAITQTVPLITFGNPVFASHVNWNGNVTQTNPTHIISAPSGGAGCIFQVDGNVSTVSVASGSQILIFGADSISGSMGSIGLSGGLGLFGNVAAPQSTGWGSSVGGAVINNYNITDAGGANSNTNKALAQVISVLKLIGLLAT